MHKSGTCIAVRDGSMAADSLALYNNTMVLTDTKISKYKYGIFGMSGSVCPSLVMTELALNALDYSSLSTFEFDILILTNDGKIGIMDQRGSIEFLDVPFYALGSGGDLAMGAMQMGATAEEAVKAASKWNPFVGGEVKCLSII